MGNENSGGRGYRVKATEYTGMGKRIDDLLFEKNLPISAISSAVGCDRVTVLYIMANNDGKVSTISKIAQFFGVSLDWLVSGKGKR